MLAPDQKYCASFSSCSEEIVDFEKLTIKFQISDNQTVAQVYPNCMTIGEVKSDLGKKFEVDAEVLVICQDGKDVTNNVKLEELVKNEFGIAEVNLKIDEALAAKGKLVLDPQNYYNKHKLPDFITVSIPNENNSSCACNNVIVEIQNQAIKKPYLGGHRDLRTGKEYFDAFTQTGPQFEKIKYDGIISRDSQTTAIRTKAINTIENRSAQVFGDATNLIYIATVSDYVIEPKPYETAEQKVKRENKLEKIILIQRNLRRYILWKFIRSAAAEYRALRAEQERRKRHIAECKSNRQKKDCVVKTFPKSKEDFDLLFAQIQRWKDAEIKRINRMYSGGSRIAELHCLLDKEVQLLNGIEKQRALMRNTLKDFRQEQHLKKLGEPVKWVGFDNRVVEMDLLRTQRVRYLTDLFKSIKAKSTKDDRLELLNKLCQVLEKELHQKPPLQSTISELIDLLEREKGLLVCTKMNDSTMETLRKRQLILFTEVIQYQDEQRPKEITTKMCEKCKMIKSISNFALRTRQSSIDVCKNCHYLSGSASDNSLYGAILRSIQRGERKRKTLASYAFIIQEDDIRFIVDKIWHGHSVLSKCNDLANLRLPRWIRSEDWSPWNCVCLTDAEARVHDELDDLSDVYHQATTQDVQSKHLLAKSAFDKLGDVDYEFVEPGQWWKVGIAEKVL